MKKRAMISQPMRGKTDEEIRAVRQAATAFLEAKGYQVVDALFPTNVYNAIDEQAVVNIPLSYLGLSLEKMAICHLVYFCRGWESARGCKLEHDAAIAYGRETMYEE